MTARCTNCNKRHSFRNTRGSKLSEQRCNCGGKLEIIGGNSYVSGQNPFEPEKTYTSKNLIGEYFHAESNRKGDLFYSHPDGFYKPLINFQLAKRKENICKNCGHDCLKADPQKGERVCMKCYVVHNWEGNLMIS